MLHGFDDYAPTTSADLHYEARTIPGADLLFARTLPELAPRQRGEVELGLLVMQEFPGLGPVETVRRERWLVWAAIAWPFADLSHGGGYGGAALLLGERLRSDGVPDGLLLVLEWRRFTRIESEPAAAGLADILAAWRPRYGLQVCYAALDEREPAYLARLRRSPAMRRLRLGQWRSMPPRPAISSGPGSRAAPSAGRRISIPYSGPIPLPTPPPPAAPCWRASSAPNKSNAADREGNRQAGETVGLETAVPGGTTPAETAGSRAAQETRRQTGNAGLRTRSKKTNRQPLVSRKTAFMSHKLPARYSVSHKPGWASVTSPASVPSGLLHPGQYALEYAPEGFSLVLAVGLYLPYQPLRDPEVPHRLPLAPPRRCRLSPYCQSLRREGVFTCALFYATHCRELPAIRLHPQHTFLDRQWQSPGPRAVCCPCRSALSRAHRLHSLQPRSRHADRP